jgi:hypothetical protein
VKTVPLEWPVEFGGKTFSEIAIARLTAGEVAEFHKSVSALPPDAPVVFPVYRDADGGQLPDGLLDALDADDRDALDKEALYFLPRRFRGAEPSASAPAAGAVTA